MTTPDGYPEHPRELVWHVTSASQNDAGTTPGTERHPDATDTAQVDSADWRECRVVSCGGWLFLRTDEMPPDRTWRDIGGSLWTEPEMSALLPLVPVLDADGKPISNGDDE